MEYYNGRLCISMRDLVDSNIMTVANYKQLAFRGKIDVVKRGGGRGNQALVAVDSLPDKYRDQVWLEYSKETTVIADWIWARYERDREAVLFYNNASATGTVLFATTKESLIANASILNVCKKLLGNHKVSDRLLGTTYRWEKLAEAVYTLRGKNGHNLPRTPQRFKKKLRAYMNAGYEGLLSGLVGNKNASKK